MGLIAYYPFNGNANDVTVNARNGVAYGGVSYGTDRFGSANSCYQSPGNGLIDIPNHLFPIHNAGRSVSIFYKCNIPYVGYNCGLFNWGSNGGLGERIGLYTSSTVIGVEYINGAVYIPYVFDTAWHHIVFTYPTTGGGSAAIKLYLDGALCTSTTNVLPVASFNTDTGLVHNIGGYLYYIPPFSNSWSGKLDDASVWDRAITACEVYQIYKATTDFTPAITGASFICGSSGISLTASAPGGTWSSGSSGVATVSPSGVVTPVSAGTAVISYTITNVCGTFYDTQSVAVAMVSSSPVVSGPSPICSGSSATFSSGLGGGTWSSSNSSVASVNASTGVVTASSPGLAIISYSVTNACGSATDTELVTVMPLPSAGTVAGPPVICPGSAVTYSSGAAGGTWSSSVSSVVTINSSTGAAGGSTTGTSIISYTVSNSCGTATDTEAVTVSLTASAGTISGPSSVCAGSTIILVDGVSGGVWSSSNAGIASVSASTGTVTGIAAGTAIITFTVTNACGTATDTQLVTVLDLPAVGIISGLHGTCLGESISLADGITGGTWSSGVPAVASVNASSGVVTGLSAGVAVISYTITNTCGSASDTQLVTVHPLPPAGTITGKNTICLGVTATLGNSVAGGIWSSGNTAVATVDGSTGAFYPVSAGTVTITYTTTPDAYGCINTAAFDVNVLPPGSLLASGSVEPVKCSGNSNGSISITINSGGIGPYQYLWSNGGTGSAAANLSAGSYTVTVNDISTGCSDTLSYTLAMPGDLDVHATIAPDRCSEGQGSITLVDILGGTGPYSVLWSTGSTAVTASGLYAGDYTVTITDNHQCSSQFAYTVTEDSCNHVVVHDVITPNGDGINDSWIIEGIGNYPDNLVSVFDKWGDVVFTAKSYSNNWTGQSVPDGTYVYLVKLSGGASAENNTLKGTLLIKR